MELGERRCRILAAVVNDYVRTAEPVGSESLAQHYDFGVKPATIRNELAAISEMGYLRQPHTSAGRVPSDLGYRYYVDRLMPAPNLGPAETVRAKRGFDPYEGEIENILQKTCRILAGLTEYTSLATPPCLDRVFIRQVVLSPVSLERILLVTVLSTGHIDHHVVNVPTNLPSAADLTAVGNLISARFQQVGLDDFSAHAEQKLPSDLLGLSRLYRKITAALKQALLHTADDEVYVEGTAHILKQPEFAHHARMASMLGVLEQRRSLFQTLSRALLGREVTVIIGSENQFETMHECSFVASSYSVGDRVCGSIGVLGPTRMDYRRAVAAVRFMASNLTALLTSLSIG
jgi:heat-inducible transcriptional repressor